MKDDKTATEFMSKDLESMRDAGCEMAIAAMRVVQHYDGIHRLSKAVAKWNDVIANEGGRDSLSTNPQ